MGLERSTKRRHDYNVEQGRGGCREYSYTTLVNTYLDGHTLRSVLNVMNTNIEES